MKKSLHRIRDYPDAIGALQPIFHNPPTHTPVCFHILRDGCVPPAGDALDVSSPSLRTFDLTALADASEIRCPAILAPCLAAFVIGPDVFCQ